MNNILSIKNACFGYQQKEILEGISLSISSPQHISLIGRNGSGKSTFIKTLLGLLPSISGEINIVGKSINSLNSLEKAKWITGVFTSPIYDTFIKVDDFILLGRYPHIQHRFTDKDTEKVAEIMSLMNIVHLSNKKVALLSDGERQKVQIAKALAQDTSIILLDEPTAHLDFFAKKELFQILQELTTSQKKTFITVTHQIHLAQEFSSQIWLVENKSITSYSPNQDLLKIMSFS